MRYCRLLLGAAAQGAAIVLLHHLGSRLWVGLPWQTFAGTEDALAGMLWLLALAGVYWLAGSSLLYALARLADVPAAIRAVRWATLPVVRRVVDGALAVSVSLATIGAPLAAGAALPPAAMPSAEDSSPPLGMSPAAALLLRREEPVWAPPLPPPSSPTPADHTMLRVVERGDNLWTLSAARLAETGTRPGAATIVPYWRRVVALNTPRLRSGDPDLIYPGETVALPPPEAG